MIVVFRFQFIDKSISPNDAKQTEMHFCLIITAKCKWILFMSINIVHFIPFGDSKYSTLKFITALYLKFVALSEITEKQALSEITESAVHYAMPRPFRFVDDYCFCLASLELTFDNSISLPLKITHQCSSLFFARKRFAFSSFCRISFSIAFSIFCSWYSNILVGKIGQKKVKAPIETRAFGRPKPPKLPSFVTM